MAVRKVTIIGMGALGVMYGYHIEKHLGRGVCQFLADSERIERYRMQPVYCNGELCCFELTDGSRSCTGGSSDTGSEEGLGTALSGTPDPAELLIFATKGSGLASAIETAKKMVGPDTILLSVLNGISSEEEIASAFGHERLLYCVVQGMDATKLGSELTYTQLGEFRIGYPENEPEKAPLLQEVLDCFDRAQIPYVKEEDILYRLWGKWMLNVGVNQTCMVYECGYGGIQVEGEAYDTMIGAMKEVLLLSEKVGIALRSSEIDSYMELIKTLDPNGLPSMRQDSLLQRYSEVELFAGTVIRKAEAFGVEVPINRQLYQRIKEIEAAYQ